MGGVDALAEKDPAQKAWQEVKNLVRRSQWRPNPKRSLRAKKLLFSLAPAKIENQIKEVRKKKKIVWSVICESFKILLGAARVHEAKISRH